MKRMLAVMVQRHLFAALAVLGLGSMHTQGAAQQPNEKNVGRLAVFQSGHVTYDGKAVTIDELRLKLAELKKGNGVVWYYREAPEKEPPAVSTSVIQAVIDNRLPISFSTKPDYSTVALPDGTVGRRAQ